MGCRDRDRRRSHRRGGAGGRRRSGQFLGVAPQAIPTPEQFQRLRLGGVDSVRIPIDWGAVQASRGAAINWHFDGFPRRRRRLGGHRSVPLHHGRTALGGEVGRRQPGQRPRAAQPAGEERDAEVGLDEPASPRPSAATARTAPSGPRTPGFPTSRSTSGSSGTSRTSSTSSPGPNPAEYGKLLKLSTPVIKGIDPGAKVVLGGMFATPKEADSKRSLRRPITHRLPRADLQADARGQVAVRRGRPPPLHLRVPGTARRTSKNCASVLKANHDASDGSMDHRARLELEPSKREQRLHRLRQGPAGPGQGAAGGVRPAQTQPGASGG